MSKLVRSVIGSLILFFTLMQSTAIGYNFVNFGGRLGRAGVNTAAGGGQDFQWSWSRGASGGTLTWFLDRGLEGDPPAPVLTLAQCDAACFAALKLDVATQLDKWGLWIDLSFAEAASAAAADVRIFFSSTPGTAFARRTANAGDTLTKAEIQINPGYNDIGNSESFSFAFLHEWGHVLGVGDLYWSSRGTNTFEGEDFCDHGLPSGPLPDPRVKDDNVMQTFGVTELDNDEIYAAEWLWGNSGSNAITTGKLGARAAGDHTNPAANHHGLTQTPMTWTYRGTVRDTSPAALVIIYFSGIQDARDIGPGTWTPTIYSDRVEWEYAGGTIGNFKFEHDCDQAPERYGDAEVTGDSATEFTVAPAGGGRQIFPFPQIFGADCVGISVPIPALSEWGLMIFILSLLVSGAISVRLYRSA